MNMQLRGGIRRCAGVKGPVERELSGGAFWLHLCRPDKGGKRKKKAKTEDSDRDQTLTYNRTVARRKRRTKNNGPLLGLSESTHRQIHGTVQLALGVLMLLVLQDKAGPVGQSMGDMLRFLFGAWGILFPCTLIASGLLHWFTTPSPIPARRWIGLMLSLTGFLGLVHISAPLENISDNMTELGGAIGFVVSVPFLLFFSKAVGYVVLSTLVLIGLFIAFEPDIAGVAALIMERVRAAREPEAAGKRPRRIVPELEADDEDEIEDRPSRKKLTQEEKEDLVELDEPEPELNIVRPVFATKEPLKPAIKAKRDDVLQMHDTRFEEWTFPAYDLLDPAQSELTVDDKHLTAQAKLIEEKLKEFEIDVAVRDAHPGPTVTQFTLKPAEGVKISRIENLKDDLALALAASSLRIEAPIPGKSLVGIEMPNPIRTTVHLREILESPEFVQSGSNLTLPLGRDVAGSAMVTPLDDMPHLLIAGATGSGKSVCMNTFLTALLFQNAPDQLKFILIDPKRVELMPYDGIPHLLTPVITESEKALQALRWAVAEMGRRLHRFSESGCRNIEEYNAKQLEQETVLPRIVIVVDELADLMMRQFRRDTEMMIVRIAQMARATGMHLIIATQRPSVDVITGLIKANIPTRIAFRVVSAVDSRTIIDSIGAEDLLGKGDMLLMTASTARPVRVQGIFVSTKEVERVINAVKIAGGGKITEEIPLMDDEGRAVSDDETEADNSALAGTMSIDLDADDNGGDDLFWDAVKVVQETGKASASLLQRRMSVGYARAAKLLDIMERKGLIGPVEGAKARKVYAERLTVRS